VESKTNTKTTTVLQAARCLWYLEEPISKDHLASIEWN